MGRDGPWLACSRNRYVTSRDEARLVPKRHLTVSSSEPESLAHASDEHCTSIRVAPQSLTQYPKPGGTNASAGGLCSCHQCSVPCSISLKTGASMISPLSPVTRGRGWGQASSHPSIPSVPAAFLVSPCVGSWGSWEGGGREGKAAVRREVQEIKEKRVSPPPATPWYKSL